MGEAPQEYTVEMYAKGDPWKDKPEKRTDEVMLAGVGQTLKVYRDTGDPSPDPGSVLKGWVNSDKGTFGIAKDRPQNGSQSRTGGSYGGRRDDATNESIQRQTAAKCAAEMAAAVGGTGPTVLANFEEFFSVASKLIAGQPDAS
jgi:hypothetical protein